MTREQITAAIEIMDTVIDCVKLGGDMGVPSGHVYAALMGTMSIETYERMIGLLIEAKRIKRSNHVLYYVEKRQ